MTPYDAREQAEGLRSQHSCSRIAELWLKSIRGIMIDIMPGTVPPLTNPQRDELRSIFSEALERALHESA